MFWLLSRSVVLCNLANQFVRVLAANPGRMKFAKLMGRAEDLLPDLQHLCLRYKELKKHLRRIGSGELPTAQSSS